MAVITLLENSVQMKKLRLIHKEHSIISVNSNSASNFFH